MKFYYGLGDQFTAVTLAKRVCNALGNGNNNTANRLLLETCAAETVLGTYKDPTERYAGAGLSQVDESTFDWLKEKFQSRPEVVNALYDEFGFTLSKVQYVELELSPLLALVFARLRYRTVADEIPGTIRGRAEYWKKHYNSSAGKGTVEHYIEQAKKLNELIGD